MEKLSIKFDHENKHPIEHVLSNKRSGTSRLHRHPNWNVYDMTILMALSQQQNLV